MIKKLYILCFVFVFSSNAFAQFVGKDNLSIALFYMQKTELDSAQKFIDLSINDAELNTQAKTWYYRGYIYKDLYKAREKTNKQSPYRLTAIESLHKMQAIGGEEFKESSSNMLKYLASTLYNDAVRSLNPKDYKVAISSFELYKGSMKSSNPSATFKTQDVKFKMALASMLNKHTEASAVIDTVQVLYIKELYVEILAIDGETPGANYNLATIYYNEAVELIKNMDYDSDIIELNKVQDYCIDIFLKSLPYMKKAYDLNYKRKETLLGLSNIYYGLNDIEKSDQYKKELEELEKE